MSSFVPAKATPFWARPTQGLGRRPTTTTTPATTTPRSLAATRRCRCTEASSLAIGLVVPPSLPDRADEKSGMDVLCTAAPFKISRRRCHIPYQRVTCPRNLECLHDDSSDQIVSARNATFG